MNITVVRQKTVTVNASNVLTTFRTKMKKSSSIPSGRFSQIKEERCCGKVKIQKRIGVFETNSSSVHSLAINPEGRRPNEIKMEDGYLIAKFGSFGCHGYFATQSEKLSYLVTCVWYLAGMPTHVEDMYGTYTWDLLEDAAKEYVDGCKGIRVDGEISENDLYGEPPYIDHQSIPDYDTDVIVDLYDRDSVVDFIWNDYVALKCSRD